MTSRSPKKNQQTVRGLAASILGQVLGEKAFAADSLDRALNQYNFIAEDRRLLTQLVYGTLRELAWLDACLKPYLNFSKTKLALLSLLRLAAYQMLCLEKVPDYAVLNESVELAKQKFGIGAGKLVNAVLRRLQEQKTTLIEERKLALKNLNQYINNNLELSIKYKEISKNLSIPSWLISRWIKRYGESQALTLALGFNQTPQLYLRCNLSKVSRESCEEELKKLGFDYERTDSRAILKLKSLDWKDLQPLLQKGWVSIQDLGSYQIVEKLAPQSSERGIDACAGKGIKATALAELLALEQGASQGLITVYDPVSSRLNELELNFKRLDLQNYEIIKNEEEFLRQDSEAWDWLLIDAPCSGLGTLARKPEIRWKTKESDIKRHAKQQLEILTEWAPKVCVGGRLVYAVCSLEPEEGRQVIEKFLQKHQGWTLQDQGEIWPGPKAGADGFYWARLIRKKGDR